MTYFQYYTFVILSEKLGAFTIQQRNYVFLYSKIMGRVTLFCVFPFATRMFLNFLISSVILVLSIGIFFISLNFSEDSTNLLGIVFTGNKDFFIMCIVYLSCGKLPYRTCVSIHQWVIPFDSKRLCNWVLGNHWKSVWVSDSVYGVVDRQDACALLVWICAFCFVLVCDVFLHAWNHSWYSAKLSKELLVQFVFWEIKFYFF